LPRSGGRLRPPNPSGYVRTDDTSFEAAVVAELPQQLYRVESPLGTLIAGLSAEAKRLGVRIRTGQRVRVKAARRDPGRGEILAVLAEFP
jgi:translation initiation factor IF-1